MKENLKVNQCVGGKEGELHQSVKLASLDLVGSNPTSFTSEKKVKIIKENAWLDTDNRRIL